MSKGAKLGWSLLGVGAGVTCIVALIQGAGSLHPISIIALVVLGSIFFSGAAYGLGWFRAPIPIGTIPRTVVILSVIWIGMGWLGYRIWTETAHSQVEYPTMEDIAISAHLPLIPNLRVNGTPMIAIGFINAGRATIQSPADSGLLKLVPENRHSTAFTDYRSELETAFAPMGGDLVSHSDTLAYHTYEGPILGVSDIQNLRDGIVDLCGLGAVRWGDNTGRYETYFARCLIAEPNHTFNWHILREDNTERRIQ